MPADESNQMPSLSEKPSLLDYLETFLPFKIPRLPFPQSAKNLDKALARIIDAKSVSVAEKISSVGAIEVSKDQAKISFIKAGAKAAVSAIKDGDHDLCERAIIAALGDMVREQTNKERISGFAVKELQANPPTVDATESIDTDWLSLFWSLAATKSREDMQSLWGRILAGEIKQPGSIKLRSLRELAVLEPSEAQLIHKYMGHVLRGDALLSSSMPFVDLLELQNLGVLSPSELKLEFTASPLTPARISISPDHTLLVQSEKDERFEIHDIIALTTFGKELYVLAGSPKLEHEPFMSLVARLRRPTRTLTLVTWGPGEGEIRAILKREELDPIRGEPDDH